MATAKHFAENDGRLVLVGDTTIGPKVTVQVGADVDFAPMEENQFPPDEAVSSCPEGVAVVRARLTLSTGLFHILSGYRRSHLRRSDGGWRVL